MENLEKAVEPESNVNPEAQEIPTEQESLSVEQVPEPAQQEELDLNQMFPGEDTDLNQLFPEKELRELLQGVHKSKTELEKINTRFVDDPDHVVPKPADEESADE